MKFFYPESQFGGFTDVDGSVRFYTRVRSLLEPDFTVLDIGCGRGGYGDKIRKVHQDLQIFKGRAAQVIGIDLDPLAQSNPFLDDFRLIEGPKWPLDDCSVDLAVSDWTLEHVEDPAAFFQECYRVLKPGGHLCMRTANRLGYIAIVSNLIPNRLHRRVLQKLQPGRKEVDVFPTVYRCNTLGKLRSALRKLNFDALVYSHEAEPSYLNMSMLIYAIGVLNQKTVLPLFRHTLYVFATKRL